MMRGGAGDAAVYDVREVSAINVAAATVEVVSPKGGVGTVSLAQCFAMNAKHNSDLCGLHNIHEPGSFPA